MLVQKFKIAFHSFHRFAPLGIPTEPHLQFMTDFPVYIWRDMFSDFRSFVISYVFPGAECAQTKNEELKMFWKALSTIYYKDPEFYLEEYSNLLLFAYHSPKWHSRYDWQVIRASPNYTRPIMSHAAHHEPCNRPRSGFALRGRNIPEFLPWATKQMRYPLRSIPNPHKIPGYAEYITSTSITEEWTWYSAERQRAIAFYSEGRNVSATDTCGPSIVDSWEMCFNRSMGL